MRRHRGGMRTPRKVLGTSTTEGSSQEEEKQKKREEEKARLETLNKSELEEEVKKLEKELESVKEKKKRVDHHINELHRYNEVKDVAQMLIGKLAEAEGITVVEVYPRFGLDIED